MSEKNDNRTVRENADDLIAGLSDHLLRLHELPESKSAHLPNILPAGDVDLGEFLGEIIDPNMTAPPKKKRQDIIHHYETLKYRHRGQSAIVALLILCISYMRRRPPFVDQATHLFFRILDEHGDYIGENISTRFNISILRTLAEYGRTDEEKLLALNGFTYICLVRAYEAERNLDGLDNGALTFSLPSKGSSAGGKGMMYTPAADDALSIINALTLNSALEHDTVGAKLIISLLYRIKNNNNIFTRIDRALEDVDGSENKPYAWSFGRPPHKR